MLSQNAVRIGDPNGILVYGNRFGSSDIPAFSPVFKDMATDVGPAAGTGIQSHPHIVTPSTLYKAFIYSGVDVMSADSVGAATNNQVHFCGITQEELHGTSHDDTMKHHNARIVAEGPSYCRVNGTVSAAGDFLMGSPGNTYLVAYDGTRPPLAVAGAANSSGTNTIPVQVLYAPQASIGGRLRTVIKSFVHTDGAAGSATAIAAAQIPANATVKEVSVVLSAAFASGANNSTLSVGDSTNNFRFIGRDTNADEVKDAAFTCSTSPGLEDATPLFSASSEPLYKYTSAGTVNLYLMRGDASAGAGLVYITYIL